MKRIKLLTAALGVALSLSSLSEDASAQNLQKTLVASGIPSGAIGAVSPPGDTERLFIIGRGGQIKILKNGVLLPGSFLNVTSLTNTSSERGLLGLAFHPDYAVNGKFYIHYTNTSGANTVRQYLVSANPDVADASSFTTIAGPISQPAGNHNGGDLAFGADGMLYMSVGDGGPQGDPFDVAQDLDDYLGKILRYDVDIPYPHIPPSNPYVGLANHKEEIWSYGWRNPWRMTFDRLTGDMWIGDVGQNAYEEISFQPASSTGGDNFGWKCREGTHCYGTSSASGCNCSSGFLIDPVLDYSHSVGISVSGGYVYRGSANPWMYGRYFYADYGNGKVWSFDPVNPAGTNTYHFNVPSCVGFGEDGNGEIYACSLGGAVYRIDELCNETFTPYCTTTPNTVGPGATIQTSGTASISNNNLLLIVGGCPAGEFGQFFYGDLQQAVPFNNGTLCVAGTHGLWRLNPPMQINLLGGTARFVDFDAAPADLGPGMIVPGSTQNFQFWYRDSVGTGSNLSDAVSVHFCP